MFDKENMTINSGILKIFIKKELGDMLTFIVMYLLHRFIFSHRLSNNNTQEVEIFEISPGQLPKRLNVTVKLNNYMENEILKEKGEFLNIRKNATNKTNLQKKKAKELVKEFLKNYFTVVLQELNNEYKKIDLLNNLFKKRKLCFVPSLKKKLYCHTNINKEAMKDITLESFYKNYFIDQLVESIFDNDPNLFYFYNSKEMKKKKDGKNLLKSACSTYSFNVDKIIEKINFFSKRFYTPIQKLIDESLKIDDDNKPPSDDDDIKPPPTPKPPSSSDEIFVAIKKYNNDNHDN